MALQLMMPSKRPTAIDTDAANSAAGAVDSRLYVTSVEKAMLVLSTFDPQRRWMSVAEIAEATGIGRSAAQRFAYTLHRLGYLQRDLTTRQYGLAARMLTLVRGMLAGHAMLERAQSALAELARATGETVSWVEPDGDDIIIVANIPSVHVAHVHLPVGSRFPALPSSSGQVFLWQASARRLAEMYGRLKREQRDRLPVHEADGLASWLQRSRRAGYALTERHLDAHGISVSAPVYNASRHVVAAINISTLKSRFDVASTRRELVPALLAASASASA